MGDNLELHKMTIYSGLTQANMRDVRIEFIIISIEDTSGSSWLYLINALTNPSSPLHPFAFSL